MAGSLSNTIFSVTVYGLNQVTLSPATQWIMSLCPPFALQLALEQGLQMEEAGGDIFTRGNYYLMCALRLQLFERFHQLWRGPGHHHVRMIHTL